MDSSSTCPQTIRKYVSEFNYLFLKDFLRSQVLAEYREGLKDITSSLEYVEQTADLSPDAREQIRAQISTDFITIRSEMNYLMYTKEILKLEVFNYIDNLRVKYSEDDLLKNLASHIDRHGDDNFMTPAVLRTLLYLKKLDEGHSKDLVFSSGESGDIVDAMSRMDEDEIYDANEM